MYIKHKQTKTQIHAQTGTGKTYTLNAALEYLSTRLVGRCVCVTFFEVRALLCSLVALLCCS